MTGELAAVTAVLGEYFDGLYLGDAERLGRVFHPRAVYAGPVAGGLRTLGMDEYLPVVARREPPSARGEARRDRIVSVGFAGTRAAVARVECAIGPALYTDLLSLVRVDGTWRIMAKVFDAEPLPVPAGDGGP